MQKTVTIIYIVLLNYQFSGDKMSKQMPMLNLCIAGLCTVFNNLQAQSHAMDPQTSELLKQMNALEEPPMESLPIETVRKQVDSAAWHSSVQLKRIENIHIPGPNGEIPLRIYIPEGAGPFPVLVYFHGGGWVFGTVNTSDPRCRSIADLAKVVVVSVDYRLAPENKFPKPLLDCFAASEWVEKNIGSYEGDPARMAVGGDSAGGNLAAAVTLLAKDQGSPQFQSQLLIYPVTNYAFDTASMIRFADGYNLTLNEMKWFWLLYLNNPEEGNNPLASTLKAHDMSGLPPALIVLAEFDPLFGEGLQYADKLHQAGVPVQVKIYPTIHGFVGLANQLDIAKQAIQEMAEQLHQKLYH